MISTPVVLAVLGSAMMHASWNFLVKASADRLLDTVALAVGGSLLAAVLLPFFPLPADASRLWLTASVFVHIAYFLALIESYKHADLSVAYPLMRGFAPVIVALSAPLFGDPYSPGMLAGIGLIGLGITLPALLGLRRGVTARAGLLYALGNSVIIALYTVLDGIGVRQSGNAISYTLWLFFFDAWGIFAVALWYRGQHVFGYLWRRWHYALGGATLTVGSYGIVLWAMTVAPIPLVAALRETSVIFAAILGIGLLREKMGTLRACGALVIALGAVVIRIGARLFGWLLDCAYRKSAAARLINCRNNRLSHAPDSASSCSATRRTGLATMRPPSPGWPPSAPP